MRASYPKAIVFGASLALSIAAAALAGTDGRDEHQRYEPHVTITIIGTNDLHGHVEANNEVVNWISCTTTPEPRVRSGLRCSADGSGSRPARGYG